MKISLPLLLIFLSTQVFAQSVLSESKNSGNLKKKSMQTPVERIINSHPTPLHLSQPSNQINNSQCNCWLQRDNSWSAVPFDGSGSSGGPGVPPDYRVDDWSTDTIHLPFNFCFFGNTVTAVYINSNGNISIGAPFSSYSADTFPNTAYSMIAPFWGDVDMRSEGSGSAFYTLTPHYLAVQWDQVGFYEQEDILLNSFQVILSDGTDSAFDNTNNIEFCYRDMQWTTGDASNGSGGFGGSPAIVGANSGDGINSVQFGLYNQIGTAYDGPFGSTDGINSLDNQSFRFNTCTSNHLSPISFSSEFCDTIQVCVSDTFVGTNNFYSGLTGLNTSIALDTNGNNGVSVVSSIMGTQAIITYRFIPDINSVGLRTIYLIATDGNGDTTRRAVLFNVSNCIPLGVNNIQDKNVLFFPNPLHDILQIRNMNAGNSFVSIKNIFGQIVFENNYSANPDIDLSNLSAGVYFIRLQNTDGIISRKIIKE